MLLLAAMDAFNLDEGTTVTAEKDDEKRVDDKRIRHVPLLRWFLA